jgi:uridine kinase
MTTQDLTDNRDRIIKNIKRQGVAKMEDIKGVMLKMVQFLNRADYSQMRPMMKNIDKLTDECARSYIKYDMDHSMTTNERDDFLREIKMKNLSSSLRAN